MLNVANAVVALNRMVVEDLRANYAGVFGAETKTSNKPWLVKRIEWRLQATEEGDLSERARRHARTNSPTTPITDETAGRRSKVIIADSTYNVRR
jgi:hypothetical protein